MVVVILACACGDGEETECWTDIGFGPDTCQLCSDIEDGTTGESFYVDGDECVWPHSGDAEREPERFTCWPTEAICREVTR